MSEEDTILENLEETPDVQAEKPEEKSVEQVDKLDPEIQRRDAQIKHWRDKAEKLEKQVPKAESKEDVEEWKAPSDPLEVVKLGKVLKDYDEQETEFIIKNASSRDIEGIIKAEKDEMVQFAIKSRREKVTKENKVPLPSGSSGGSSYSELPKEALTDRDAHKKFWKEQQERQKSEGI
jgi:hypothetical protein